MDYPPDEHNPFSRTILRNSFGGQPVIHNVGYCMDSGHTYVNPLLNLDTTILTIPSLYLVFLPQLHSDNPTLVRSIG